MKILSLTAATFALGLIARPDVAVATDGSGTPPPMASEIALTPVLWIAPPPPRVVVAPRPRAGWIWSPGYWRWTGRAYVWIDGIWLAERRGYMYVPSHWERLPRGWVLVPGRWVAPRV